MHKSIEIIPGNPRPPKNDAVLFFKPKYDNISEVSSNESHPRRHHTITVKSDVHLPPPTTGAVLPKSKKVDSSSSIQIYKSGKWKQQQQQAAAMSDEEPIIQQSSTASSDEEDSSGGATTTSNSFAESKIVEKVAKKRRSNQSASSSLTTAQGSSVSRSEVESVSGISKTSKLEETSQFLGIYVHQTSNLKFDAKIRDPNVVVSLVDCKTGQWVAYSQETLKEKQLDQPFILPESSGCCTFISNM